MYDTYSGRWMQEDPDGFDAGDGNLYRYVGNSPTIFTDPSGLHPPLQQQRADYREYVNRRARVGSPTVAFDQWQIDNGYVPPPVTARPTVIPAPQPAPALMPQSHEAPPPPSQWALDQRRIDDEYRRLQVAGQLPDVVTPTCFDTTADVLWNYNLVVEYERAEIARRMGISYSLPAPLAPQIVRDWGPGGYKEQVLHAFGGFTGMPGMTPAKGGQIINTNLRPLHRPYLRAATLNTIRNAARRTADGRFIDGATDQPINGPIDIGHIPGREEWRLVTEAMERGMTQAEFNNWVNSHPEWFRIESRPSNQSHRNEAPPG